MALVKLAVAASVVAIGGALPAGLVVTMLLVAIILDAAAPLIARLESASSGTDLTEKRRSAAAVRRGRPDRTGVR